MERLGALIKYLNPAPRNDSVWKCPLGRENAVESKKQLMLGKGDFVAVLAKHPSLVQRLCTVYFQDFIWCAGHHTAGVQVGHADLITAACLQFGLPASSRVRGRS